MEKNLFDKAVATEYYEQRYAEGYMADWPLEKKQRVFELIRGLGLPQKGKALEFGCGNGVFTEVIKQALPDWEVYGSDISKVAVGAARERFPHCRFFINDDPAYASHRFDLLLTHHVLEHVYDIEEIAREMAGLVTDQGRMLHILPCGNPGSLEYNLCRLRTDGINAAVQNRFFFEDEGHVRRLDTDRLAILLAPYGFRLRQDYYSNQYFGAIKWIVASDKKFIYRLTDPRKALSGTAALKLRWLRAKLLFVKRARDVAKARMEKGSGLSRLKRVAVYPFLWTLKRGASLVTSYYNDNAQREWERKKNQRNGSEMYLYFSREQ